MPLTIGIRREDKSEWERRVPLVPADLAVLKDSQQVRFVIQPSPIRVFGDEEYAAAGVGVEEDLSRADLIIAVKEVPKDLILDRKVYLFFSHTVKGQAYNMPMLQRLLDGGCTLIDYERIADEQNRRLIFFSVHAGHAGMINTLAACGRRLAHEGTVTPLAEIGNAHTYGDLQEVRSVLTEIGRRIETGGLRPLDRPVVIGIAGYGNVARGCREILEFLPVREIEVEDLPTVAAAAAAEVGPLVKVVFHEEDMVEPRSSEAQFVLQDYYQHPQNYRGVFERHLPHLDVLVNTIYWDDRYPRLLTRKWAKANYGSGKSARLKVVGDISCDIGGSIELTVKTTQPDEPCYVVSPDSLETRPGVAGDGPVIMAIDNLPCELPRESSEHFSSLLREMIGDLARADFTSNFEGLHLPSHLKKAIIVHRGVLTPNYRYLQEYLDKSGK